jgi:homoserine kinase type II
MQDQTEAELTEVLSHFDLGELVQHERDHRGVVNVSYFIETMKGGERHKYFLRKYKHGVRREELLFEHSLIEHIVRQAGCPVAAVHRTRRGETFLHRPGLGSDSQGDFYAVFDFLPGQDRYTWIGPRLPPAELRRAGALLARFHSAASTLKPRGKRAEPKITELLAVIDDQWVEGRAKSKGTVFDVFVASNFALVRKEIGKTRAALTRPAALLLPEVIIHSDYHPGNLKFAGHEITGLVDFDWSKVDRRAFDVGLAVWYFCVSWEGASDGRLRLDDARVFLAAYQNSLPGQGTLPPLSAAELRYIPHMLGAGNIYVLYWTLRDYFGKDVDPVEYLIYLKHSVAFMRWFAAKTNRARVVRMLDEIPRPGASASRARSREAARPRRRLARK